MILISVVSCLAVVGIVGAVGWHYRGRIAVALFNTLPHASPAIPLAPIPAAPQAAPVPIVAPTPTVATAVAKVNKSVVSIQVAQEVPSYVVNIDGSVSQTSTLQTIGGGSGFFVTKNGIIVTNKHVVNFDGAVFTIVTSSGKKYTATVLATDPTLDVALLKVQNSSASFSPVTFGNSDTLQLGQNVVAIGYALGELNNSISAGIVSGLGRDITAGDAADDTTEQLDKLIQTDAAINPGNSGGPLLTLDGTVIGINVATAQGSQSIGFALPINSVKSFIAQND
jgi:S1-C subfamily serine protease